MRWGFIAALILVTASATVHGQSTTAATAESSGGEVIKIKRDTVVASIDVDGYFEPIEPLEVRIRPQQFQGDLRVKSAAAHGASVKQGDALLEIDSTDLGRQVADADNALVTARANLGKAESEDYLGQQGDALAMQSQENDLANAVSALKWWEDVDGKQLLKGAELSVRNVRNNVEDQTDELDQLKKMYKTEELTNATADIVVKRAVRGLELAQIQLGLAEARAGKVKGFDYPVARQKLTLDIDEEKQKLAQLKAQQESQRILRKTAIGSARLALEKAEAKLAELKSDLEALTVHAPWDGTLYYGQLVSGGWQNANPRLLRAGEKVAAGQVLMTLSQPGKLRVVVDVPESKVSWIKPGMPARIVPVALPDAAGAGSCGEPVPCGTPREGSQAFQVAIEPASVDPGLLPGMKVAVRIDAGTVRDALVVPVAAVSKGRVEVHADGKDVWREVVTGKSDGELIEIRQGLNEGDRVLAKAGK